MKMPVYEYHCRACGHCFSRFFWRISDAEDALCRCGSSDLEQLISRVAMHGSSERRLENLADPSSWGDVDESDPRSMARMMKRLGSEMGEELGPEFDEVVDRLEAGEDPESVEASMGGEMPGDSSGPDTDNLF